MALPIKCFASVWQADSIMSEHPSIVLYDTPGSPCARRVRISLLEKGLPFQRVVLDLAKMENKADWYLRINPNGQVPAVRIGDTVLYESNVITEYLDALWPQVLLYPEDAQQYAEVKAWQTFEMRFSKHFGLLQYARLLGPLSRIQYSFEDFMAEARKRTSEPALLEWERRVWCGEVLSAQEELEYEQALYERLGEVEQALEGKTYLVGECFSQAEISVYPRLAMYPYIRLPISAQRYPNVSAWMARLQKRRSFMQSSTLVDRLMSGRLLPAMLRTLDPLQNQAGSDGVSRRVALSLGRKLFAGDVMQRQRQLDQWRERRRKLTEQFVRVSVFPEPQFPPLERLPTELAGDISLWGCPFNTETLVAAAILIAVGKPFVFKPIYSPLGEEYSSRYRSVAGRVELPYLEHDGRALDGWPYALGRIAEHVGQSDLYPSAPLLRARVQIACLGDSVVNFKYVRPLYWSRVVGPWLKGVFPQGGELDRQLTENGVDVSQKEYIQRAWAGEIEDGGQSCFALLDKRLAWLIDQCTEQGFIGGLNPTIADIAEWVRLQEAQTAGYQPAPEILQSAVFKQWLAWFDGQAFCREWRGFVEKWRDVSSATDSVRVQSL